MHPLEKSLRNKLERTVKDARDIADAAAWAALNHLGISEATAPAHLTDNEKKLRRKLRAHGRQLGDALDTKTKTQEINRLIEAVSYEHWHRMLFARFLAENNLLMYPDPVAPVAITLEECNDLAADEGAKDGWELASRFASRMLPQIFRQDFPVFELILPPEYRQKLEHLVMQLPEEVFTASDSLGWVYQFWQAKKKDEINGSEVKIGAREIPAVTQLFTEPYMVSFLLDNSLGAWWAARQLNEYDLKTAQNEDELRTKAALPGMPLRYLRFIRDDSGNWTPAAGTFESWPENLRELKVLDPCCGSGHFLVATLLMLVPMRMQMELISSREAVEAVLRDNLHGLEIDKRCIEIAVFAIALNAWRYPDSGGYRQLPALQLACSGLSISVAKEEWKRLAPDKQNIGLAFDWMYELFKDAPILGSLLNPAKSDAAKIVEWDEISGILEQTRSQEDTDETHEAGVVAQGLAKAAVLLSGKYNLIITNVPYLARGKQGETLKKFCEAQYKDAKNELATVFLARCLEFCCEGGGISIVIPQNWLFLSSYKKFRRKLLTKYTWNLIARLGFAAFDVMDWWAFNTSLINISNENCNSSRLFNKSELLKGHLIQGLDASEPRSTVEKAVLLQVAEIKQIEQAKQIENPDARLVLGELASGQLLSKVARYGKGSTTGDRPRFVVCFWELSKIEQYNTLWLNTPTTMDVWGGREHVTTSPIDGEHVKSQRGARIHGQDVWSKAGIAVCKMRTLHHFHYRGEVFDDNIGVISPHDWSLIMAIWAFVSSGKYLLEIRKIDQKLNVTAGTLTKVPFDTDYWTQVAFEKYPKDLAKPYSDDPTQWIFHGHPAKSANPLQVAVLRLLGYRWPTEMNTMMELSDEARALVHKCEELLSYADKDGIVCIPPVRGEASATDRLLNLLAVAFGDKWNTEKLNEFLKQAECADKTLETWLRDKFFTQHCNTFHQRPFIWHIWDGLRDGFAALVNYHRLDRKTLETLIYTYLGDWISRQKQNILTKVDGAEEKLAAAEALKKRLELILEGEYPYDIFVRWKPIENQPIGWEPDLNDGVRLNIRPFLCVPEIGKRRAGVLRDKPNISWDKDRGKDIESAPWYYLFKGDRINDHHLSLKEKHHAREKKRKKATL